MIDQRYLGGDWYGEGGGGKDQNNAWCEPGGEGGGGGGRIQGGRQPGSLMVKWYTVHVESCNYSLVRCVHRDVHCTG